MKWKDIQKKRDVLSEVETAPLIGAKDNSSPGAENKKPSFFHKKFIVSFVVLLLLVVIGGSAFFLKKRNQQGNVNIPRTEYQNIVDFLDKNPPQQLSEQEQKKVGDFLKTPVIISNDEAKTIGTFLENSTQ